MATTSPASRDQDDKQRDDSGPAGVRGQDFPAAGLRASTLAPRTPYLRAVFSFVVPRKQSKRAVTRTS